MVRILRTAAVGAACVYSAASSAAVINLEPRATGSLDSFIATESPIALQGVLNNIGADGADASGASAGVVVASPSKSDPDCVYPLAPST